VPTVCPQNGGLTDLAKGGVESRRSRWSATPTTREGIVIKKSLKQVVSAAGVSLGLVIAVASPALAATVYTTNGSAWNTTSKAITVKDSSADGHEVEAQVYLQQDGTRYTLRAGDGSNVTASRNFTKNIAKFRVCRLMVFDQCSTWHAF